ncbi:MAG: hypothetical protein ABR599_12615 [Gemmatimonadota bacterium]
MRSASALAVLAAMAGGCRAEPSPAPDVTGPGTYVVLTDSSRVAFVLPADPEPIAGTLGGVRGSLRLEEDDLGFLRGSGTLSVDLGAVAMVDSARARSLTGDLLQAGAGPEFRSAELRVREITGRHFRSDLAPGAATPVTARGQLQLQRRALSRPFDGQIAPSPQGYRVTSSTPLVLSLREIGLSERLPGWLEEAGLRNAADQVVVSVDLRLAKRDGGAAED